MLKKYGLYFLAVGLYAVLNGASYADESLTKEYREIQKKAEQGDANAKKALLDIEKRQKSQQTSASTKSQGRYQKIAANGNRLADNAQQWSCVSDEETGLMWEVKTEDGLHNKDKEYRWGGKGASKVALSKYLGNNKRKESRWDGGGKRYPNWEALVDGTNSEVLCGHSNWRVPTLYELSSLVYCSNGAYDWQKNGCRPKNVDRDDYDRPTINTTYFPNTQEKPYWSSSSVGYFANGAWAVDFKYGNAYVYHRASDNHVRLVRVGQ